MYTSLAQLILKLISVCYKNNHYSNLCRECKYRSLCTDLRHAADFGVFGDNREFLGRIIDILLKEGN